MSAAERKPVRLVHDQNNEPFDLVMSDLDAERLSKSSDWTVVEYVPASHLQGAVEERDKLARYLAWRLAPQQGPPPMEYEEMAVLVARLSTSEGHCAPDPCRSLAARLISFDEPESTGRRTITLTRIIEKARAALGGEA